ncbi:MAG: hypothetical protein ABIH27_03560 [Candidatus Omnitrophota bacterium]
MKETVIKIELIILMLLLIGESLWLVKELKYKDREIKNMQIGFDFERQIEANLQKKLLSAKNQLDKDRQELDNTLKQLAEVNNRLAASEDDNAKLLREKKSLEAKLHSLNELRGAIQQTKSEIRQQVLAKKAIEKAIKKEINANKVLQGNAGFLIKDGRSTYKPVVKIEVRPNY